jgi:hypothetical protein
LSASESTQSKITSRSWSSTRRSTDWIHRVMQMPLGAKTRWRLVRLAHHSINPVF